MNESYVTGEFSVDLTRVIGGYLFPTHLMVSYDIDFTEEATAGDVDRFFAKVKYWVDNVLSKSVAVDVSCDATTELAFGDTTEIRFANNIVMCPTTPDERTFAVLLASKLEAFGNGLVVIERMSVSNAHSTYKVSYCVYADEWNETLPDQEQWVGEKSFYKTPWWNRADLTTRDEEQEEGDEHPPRWAHDLKITSDIDEPEEPKAEIIEFKFRPQVIDCDKEE